MVTGSHRGADISADFAAAKDRGTNKLGKFFEPSVPGRRLDQKLARLQMYFLRGLGAMIIGL